MNLKNTVARVLSAVLITGVILCAVVAEDNAGNNNNGIRKVEVITAQKGTITEYISITGNLRAKQHSMLCFALPGIIEALYVEVGDVVKENQELAAIDAATYKLYLAQAKAGLQAAEAVLRKMKSGFTKEEVEQAKAAMEAAKAAMDKIVSGFRDEDIKMAEAAFDAASAGFNNADNEYKRMKNLLAEGTISQSTFDNVETQWKSAKARFEQSKLQMEMLKTGNRKEDIEAVTAQYKAALERYKQIQEGFRPEDIETAEAQAAVQKAALELAEQRVNDSVLKAPYQGVITGRFLSKGSVAQGPVIEIMDISELELYLPVPDIHSLKIKKGAQVIIDIDGGPKNINRKVKSVNHKIDQRSLTFEVIVVIFNKEFNLKAGMLARARVSLEEHNNVITLPEKAVIEQRLRNVVFTIVEGRVVLKEVELGISSEGMVEIKSGINEGDIVVVEGNIGLREGSIAEIGGK
ncbi:MAG: efflux RND transporter periplasmic adaptor subunit [Planctomycetota bacterium]